MERIETFAALAERIVDLTAIFNPEDYVRWTAKLTPIPRGWRVCYGLPELHRAN